MFYRKLQWVPLNQIIKSVILLTYLFLGFKDIASKNAAGPVSSNIAEDLEILGVVRHIEYSICSRREWNGKYYINKQINGLLIMYYLQNLILYKITISNKTQRHLFTILY